MPDADQAEADRLARRLSDSLADVSYHPPGADSPIPLSLSIGAAVFPDDSPSRLDVLNLADTRLLHAKAGQGTEGERIEVLRNELISSMEGFSILNALVAAVDNKDRYTRKHSEDVVTHCLQITQTMGLSEREQFEIQVAALLHDVGKIGVSDAILRKPGKLTNQEYEAIKQHPTMGAIIVSAVPGFEFTLDAVRHHHERWDGNGYPSGLKRDETPLMARIMAVGDAFSAMTTDRTYRKGMSAEIALGVLAEGAGSQWDPDCVAAFLAARSRMPDGDPTA
jgi:HD-GYP domain-containing protein (c-di-GMP phosphodiesterase class II)